MVASRPATCEKSARNERYRWLFTFNVYGDLRFISHHDTLRLFRRALARAALPVRYSEGFNPHPRITIPLPRPVGVASQAETMVVETEMLIDPQEALARLDRHTPTGLEMKTARRLEVGENPQPNLVQYRLEAGDRSPNDLAECIARALAADAIPVERKMGKVGRPRSVDIRPYIADLRTKDGGVEFTLRVTGNGSAKPAEIAGLLGFDPRSSDPEIRRLKVQWR